MVNNQFTDGTFMKGKCIPTATSMEDIYNEKNYGPISIKTSFLNYLNFDVTIVMRNGLRYTVPFTPTSGKHIFIVREEYTVKYTAIEEVKKLLSVITGYNSEYLKAFKDAFYNSLNAKRSSGIIVAIDTNIESEVISYKNGVYLTDKDLLLSHLSNSESISHPYASHTVVVDKYNELIQFNNGLNFFIEVVDNENQFNNRFYLVANEVYEIKSIVDIDRESGVYFGTFSRNGIGRLIVNKKSFTIKQAEEILGLHKTREEALNHGDNASSRVEELEKIKHATSISKIELEAKLQEYKLEQEGLKLNLANNEYKHKSELLRQDYLLKELESKNNLLESSLKQEKLNSDIKLLQLKETYERNKFSMEDHYSQRTYERKDTSDFMKTLPTLLMSVATLLTLLIKTK